ncbi:radical SAM protein [Clostridium sp. ZS2-4]|uniref:radical SAM protein n=1 Tax=Clostridium sp. ZS2-4 TaxID=2987703 RepID=UPI00227C950B|nr:radical SAM protein [Clostridium sp. ZS2-4]MCY6354935.1 radical SAM protein [Clostridium sp. ZS2-4]
MSNIEHSYEGFEMGPIRPPSEAESLMLRVTRNCPWNQCKFCGLYKGKKFSIRPKEHVLKDIDLVKKCIDTFDKIKQTNDDEKRKILFKELEEAVKPNGEWAYHSALSWYKSGMKSIFLQDANTMIIKPDDLVEILLHIKANFPQVERITSYGRSHTIARIKDEDLQRIAQAGLNRIHIGMESASDKVLELVKKGVDKETHIKAGQKVKKAGIELSEYFMPGLGGNEYSRENALETADALNQINPDFIRIRTLAVPNETYLHKDYEEGIFTRTNDVKMVEELLLLIENLEGITSTIKSDHILNLIPEVEGVLPQDKDKMISALKWFLDLEPKEQMIFRIGRRTGNINERADLMNPVKRNYMENVIKQNNISLENIDAITDELIKRFI